MLSVIANENPLHIRVGNEQIAQLNTLVLLPAAEKSRFRWAPVRQQHGTRGETMVGQEFLERAKGIPSARR